MPNLKLTQVAVERLKPPATGRVEYWDSGLPGFGLRVAAPRPGHREGRKTWQVMYRVNGKLVRETLGTLGTIPKVDEARDRARASLAKAQRGIHPGEERRQVDEAARRQAEAEAARQRDTLAVVLDRYLAEHGEKRWRPDTLKEVHRCFEADVTPVLGARPVADVTRREIRELLDTIVARGKAPHASHVLRYLRPALGWGVEKEIISANPADGISDPDPRQKDDRARDRYLDHDEIRLFWGGCERIGWPFGLLFKLLLLTGQRRDELAQARWLEFDLSKATWTLPGERVKNGKAHVVHLTPLAIEILQALPTFKTSNLLFTTNGKTPVSGFGRARDRLAEVMLELRRNELIHVGDGAAAERAAIEHFTIHDLRRTTATGMAELKIEPHITEKVLNHTSGKISGVAAIYNRFEYLEERKAALEAWSRHVEALVGSSAPSNLVRFSVR